MRDVGRKRRVWSLAVLLAACAVLSSSAQSVDQLTIPELELDDAWAAQLHPQGRELEQPRGRSLASVITVKGLPVHFVIRSVIDPALCVHRVDLTRRPVVAALAAARARSGLPPMEEDNVDEYGPRRLVLLPCAGGATDTFLAETVLGRFYHNNGTNYRNAFLKPSTDNGVCVYGVNASYTAGHPVFGVSDSSYYEGSIYAPGSIEEADELDWFDDYALDYAPYLRYGYNATAAAQTVGVFKPPNPLPANMLDASGWGPFHSSWGDCMRNPTVDSAAPSEDPSTEPQLQYMSWIFVGATDTASVKHLPRAMSKTSFALLTLGPDRPQPDMSPEAGMVDVGDLSASMGGIDRPYGNGYSTLVSKELCMTVTAAREGAYVRLAQCNPVMPRLEQVYQLVSVKRPRKSAG